MIIKKKEKNSEMTSLYVCTVETKKEESGHSITWCSTLHILM